MFLGGGVEWAPSGRQVVEVACGRRRAPGDRPSTPRLPLRSVTPPPEARARTRRLIFCRGAAGRSRSQEPRAAAPRDWGAREPRSRARRVLGRAHVELQRAHRRAAARHGVCGHCHAARRIAMCCTSCVSLPAAAAQAQAACRRRRPGRLCNGATAARCPEGKADQRASVHGLLAFSVSAGRGQLSEPLPEPPRPRRAEPRPIGRRVRPGPPPPGQLAARTSTPYSNSMARALHNWCALRD